MSTVQANILDRLQRLQQFASLFQQELGEVTALVKKEFGITFDPVSTSPEEMQQMLANLEKKNTPIDPKNRAAILGADLQKRLHSSVINGGAGFIKPDDEFKQYQECISSTPIGQVVKWPEGFYLNSTTGEIQLLLQGSDTTFMFDRLPGTEVSLCFVVVGEAFPTRIEDMTDDEFSRMRKILDEVLERHSIAAIARPA